MCEAETDISNIKVLRAGLKRKEHSDRDRKTENSTAECKQVETAFCMPTCQDLTDLITSRWWKRSSRKKTRKSIQGRKPPDRQTKIKQEIKQTTTTRRRTQKQCKFTENRKQQRQQQQPKYTPEKKLTKTRKTTTVRLNKDIQRSIFFFSNLL